MHAFHGFTVGLFRLVQVDTSVVSFQKCINWWPLKRIFAVFFTCHGSITYIPACRCRKQQRGTHELGNFLEIQNSGSSHVSIRFIDRQVRDLSAVAYLREHWPARCQASGKGPDAAQLSNAPGCRGEPHAGCGRKERRMIFRSPPKEAPHRTTTSCSSRIPRDIHQLRLHGPKQGARPFFPVPCPGRQ